MIKDMHKDYVQVAIYLDVPKWQVGQEVSVYFPDTMQKKAICEDNMPVPIKYTDYGIECGNCGKALPGGDQNYCPQCGKEIKWYE